METVILIWLGLLSLLILYSARLVIKLFSVKNRGLKETIYEVLESNYKTNKEIEEIKKTFIKHLEKSQHNLYKTALVRFNPFERVGGEQSYSLAVLDEKNNGLVLTFLYTREGVRTYIKEVLLGKGKEVDLSKEEKEAIVLANQNKIKN